MSLDTILEADASRDRGDEDRARSFLPRDYNCPPTAV
jgi:hypothetical protein